MPFDENPEDHGGGDGDPRHDPISSLVTELFGGLDDMIEALEVCEFCTKTIIAHELFAQMIAKQMDEETLNEEASKYIAQFMMRSTELAKVIREEDDE